MKLLLLVIVLCSYAKAESHCFVASSDVQCPNSNVQFWLYSQHKLPKLINPLQLSPIDFVGKQKIVIVLHGYTGNHTYAPNDSIRPALLMHANVHVISIDYGALVKEPCYQESVQNVPLVSKCLAQLINNLIKANIVQNENLHLIGFSLGAQVAGQTANYVNQKLNHITALDPAKPLFTHVDKKRYVDKTDAEFVDVIHTDILHYGLLKPVGHADFYPNFGRLHQPGCETVSEQTSCNHKRAAEFYAESIIPEHNFWGQSSENTNQIVSMGYFSPSTARGIFFLKTASKSPFALPKHESISSDIQFGHNLIQIEFMTYIDSALEAKLLLQQQSKKTVKKAKKKLRRFKKLPRFFI